MRRNQMKNKIAIIAIVTAFMMTGCQSNAENSEDTEALKKQIAHLEQQVSDLEQLLASGTMHVAEVENVQNQTEVVSDSDAQSVSDNNVQSQEDSSIGNDTQFQTNAGNNQQQNDTNIGNSQQQNDTNVGNSQQQQNDTNIGYSHVPGHDESIYHNSAHSAVDGSISGQQSTSASMATTYTMEDLSNLVQEFVTRANAAVPSGTMSQDMEQFFAFKQEEKQIDDLLDQHEDELEYLYKKQSLTRDEYKKLERELDLLDDKLDTAKDQLEFVFGIDD